MAEGRTILVVDDERKLVEVVKSYLENAGYRVECAFSGEEALARFQRCGPALVVLDLMLPGLPGEEVCRRLRACSNVPVLMLTAKAEEESILHGLDIGADDYITKPFSPRQLVARVGAVLRRAGGESAPEDGILEFQNGELRIDGARHEVRKRGDVVPLTPNEFRIVLTLAGRARKVFTREELISQALTDFDGYDRVIDSHIKNIRQKLEDDPRNPLYIVTVHGVGYKFGGAADGR